MSHGEFQRQLHEVARERVARIRAQLGDEANRPSPGGRLDSLREAHTLKGEARLTGRDDIAELAHELETLLDPAHEAGVAAAEDLLRRLEELVGPSSERSKAPLLGRRQSIEQALLRVDLGRVLGLTRTSSELRAQQQDLARFATTLAALARDATAGEVAGIPARLRGAAVKARELSFEQDQRTEELEHQLSGIRMLRLTTLFDHLRLAALQVAEDLGKPVEVTTEGGDLAVDRQVLDAVAEPLLHLVRNAVDHGLESGRERTRLGKPSRGALRLSATQVGRTVHLVVADDGRGLDLEAVRDVMVAIGEWTADRAKNADHEALTQQFFNAGFTTRRTVSALSGRGLGLDIVRRRAEALGGEATVSTEEGRGSSFRISVPVSMVADPVVPIEVNGQMLALAISEVSAMHPQLSARDVPTAAGTIQLEGRRLRFCDLGALLGEPPEGERGALVVVRQGTEEVALSVDRLLPVAAAVRRGLDPFLEGLQLLRGTVTVAGRLVLLLDSRELLRRAETVETSEAEARPFNPAAPRVLVVDDSALTRDVLVSTLEMAGCTVHEAENGEEALAVLSELTVDVVVTDLDMPVLDGFGLIERIRASERLSALPIVVLTTRASDRDLTQASRLGADAYLTKMRFRSTELTELVHLHAGGGAR